MGKTSCCDKGDVKKGPWSSEEDEKLKAYVEKHGTGGNWIALPRKIGQSNTPLPLYLSPDNSSGTGIRT